MFVNPSAVAAVVGQSQITSWLTQPFTDEAARILTTAESQAYLASRSWSHRHAFLAAIDHQAALEGVEEQMRHDFVELRLTHFVEKWCRHRPRGVLSVLERLGPEHAPCRGAYVSLFDIMAEEGEGAKTLCHDPRISFDRVLQFAEVPDWMRTAKLPPPDDLPIYTARSLGQIATKAVATGRMTREQITSTRPSRFYDPSDWLSFAGYKIVFPPPKWPGSERLKPLADEDALQEASKRFGNCSFGWLGDCLIGSKALYIWEDDEAAMVSVVQVGSIIAIDQVAGLSNKPVSHATLGAIMAEFPDADGK